MRCEGCRNLMAKEREDELDRSSELKLQSWRCLRCGGAIEQITILSEHTRGSIRRIRYAVRPWTNAASSMHAVKRTPASRD